MAQRQQQGTPKIAITEQTFELRQMVRRNSLVTAREVDAHVISGELTEAFGIQMPFRTATLVAYIEPDQRLGAKIEFQGLTFPVPPEYIGMSNVALVTDGYTLEKFGCLVTDNNVIPRQKVALVNDFPRTDGHYLLDANSIPHGSEVKLSDPNARYLRRNTKYVGAVVRYTGVTVLVDLHGWGRGAYDQLHAAIRL